MAYPIFSFMANQDVWLIVVDEILWLRVVKSVCQLFLLRVTKLSDLQTCWVRDLLRTDEEDTVSLIG